ncbi:MAG: MmcQ/YjbR family DNA-binding protein [Thomasclavelia ramosa]|nr:MmcQ/YjbR family DNA-binding protein [Thomasclavelia ramosa]MBU9877727.1 MmcQ/YjbR family DNA-binding protein [Thomasclavelia ramosa]MBV4097651.1 MmcQ/YjbR family DNA-binding protein [Thomasclavelia ramosa]MBV4119640.1 MmcQ/YjbR family DNA-binding protein [Thomasclavelia ramosa]
MSATLKILETKKWYGLIINIPYRCLNIDKEGKVDILNVKNTPEKINALIDHIHYFPAYHMNKKHWISILLDRTVQITQVEKLLDESYQLVTKK